MPTVYANKVGFSGKTRLFVGPYRTEESLLTNLGLLGQNATFNLEQTFRTKSDYFPEVPVAQAIQAQGATLETTLREWRKDTLLAALGLYQSDITEIPGGDTTVTDETYTFSADNLIVLKRPMKAGSTITVKHTSGTPTYTAGTDYLVIPRDLEGRTLIVRLTGGTITAGQSVKVSYTYNLPTRREYPVGQVATIRYWTVKLVEEFTTGAKAEVWVPKARIGLRGNIAFNSVEEGMELPIAIQAVRDPTAPALLIVREYEEP